MALTTVAAPVPPQAPFFFEATVLGTAAIERPPTMGRVILVAAGALALAGAFITLVARALLPPQLDDAGGVALNEGPVRDGGDSVVCFRLDMYLSACSEPCSFGQDSIRDGKKDQKSLSP